VRPVCSTSTFKRKWSKTSYSFLIILVIPIINSRPIFCSKNMEEENNFRHDTSNFASKNFSSTKPSKKLTFTSKKPKNSIKSAPSLSIFPKELDSSDLPSIHALLLFLQSPFILLFKEALFFYFLFISPSIFFYFTPILHLKLKFYWKLNKSCFRVVFIIKCNKIKGRCKVNKARHTKRYQGTHFLFPVSPRKSKMISKTNHLILSVIKCITNPISNPHITASISKGIMKR
jgi:hypothetical protein